jgi:hypothetical protein
MSEAVRRTARKLLETLTGVDVLSLDAVNTRLFNEHALLRDRVTALERENAELRRTVPLGGWRRSGRAS